MKLFKAEILKSVIGIVGVDNAGCITQTSSKGSFIINGGNNLGSTSMDVAAKHQSFQRVVVGQRVCKRDHNLIVDYIVTQINQLQF